MYLFSFLDSNKEYIIGGLSLPLILRFFFQQYQNFSITLENYLVLNNELDDIKEEFVIEHRTFFSKHCVGTFSSTSFQEADRMFNKQDRYLVKEWIKFNIENKKLVFDFFFLIFSWSAFWLKCSAIKETINKKNELQKWLQVRRLAMHQDLNKSASDS